jgi:hypothetical protein
VNLRSPIQALQKRVVRPVLHWVSPKIAFALTHSIMHLLPESEWYQATFRITRFMAFISKPFSHGEPYRAEWMLYFWLKHLIESNRPFPIPTRAVGVEAILEARANSSGFVMVSVHMPLAHLALRSLVEMGFPPDAVLANKAALRDGKFPVGGRAEGVPGLAAGSGMVLVKARSILRRGGSVAALIDVELGTPLDPSILRLVGAMGARLLFALTEVQKNGEVLTRFYIPPDPFCRTTDGVKSNIAFLKAKVLELLNQATDPQSECLLRPPAESVSQ